MPKANKRPSEILRVHGPRALTDSEALAILLGNNNEEKAKKVLDSAGCLHDLMLLDAATLQELTLTAGERARLLAALELTRRYEMPRNTQPQIRAPGDIYELCRDMRSLEREELRVICLNTKNFVTYKSTIYKGSLDTNIIRIGEIFKPAISVIAASIVIIHNHPSGDPTPSPEDIRVTEMVVTAGKNLDIKLMDHVIIGTNGFVSLRERNLGGFGL